MQRRRLVLNYWPDTVVPWISWGDLKALNVPLIDGGGRQKWVPITVAGAVELWNLAVDETAKHGTLFYYGTGSPFRHTARGFEPMTRDEYLDQVVRDALNHDLAVQTEVLRKRLLRKEAKKARRRGMALPLPMAISKKEGADEP